MKNLIKILVLASGRGSNFRAVAKAVKEKQIPNAKIIALITDKHKTGAESIAKDYGIDAFVINYKDFKKVSDFDSELFRRVVSLSPDLILALGYMRVLRGEILDKFKGRIMNIHPSLLPSFKGLNAQQQALDYGVKVTGATVHFVDNTLDGGPIIAQTPVQVPENISYDDLSQLILLEEHKLIVHAVSLFCESRLSIDGARVRVKNKRS